jgi:fucose 4-O-acetylase-like acetyltransferase
MTARPPARRLQWLDVARGVGVILVVFGHVWRGLLTAGVLPDGALFRTVDEAIYLFHMPLFFLLAGLVFPGTAARSNIAAFVRSRGLRLIYPLMLWTYLLILLRVIFSSYTNRDVSFGDLLRFPLPPYELFWFLWALFLVQLLAYACLRPSWPRAAGLGMLIAAAVAAFVFRDQLPGMHRWFAGALRSLPPFVLGVVLSGWLLRPAPPLPALKRAGRGLAAAAALAAIIAVYLAFDVDRNTRLAMGMAAATACTLMLMEAAQLAPRRVSDALSVIGRASMTVFLTHVFFAGAARAALSAAGVDDVGLHALAGTSAGLIGPVIFLSLAQRWKLTGWLGF